MADGDVQMVQVRVGGEGNDTLVQFDPVIPTIKQKTPFRFTAEGTWQSETIVEVRFSNFRELAPSSAGYHKVGKQLWAVQGRSLEATITETALTSDVVELDPPPSPQQRLIGCNQTTVTTAGETVVDPPLDEKP